MKNKLLEKIENIIEFKLCDIKEDYKLSQLGIDSIKLAQVASILEEKINRELSLKEMMEMTPKKLLDLIDESVKS